MYYKKILYFEILYYIVITLFPVISYANPFVPIGNKEGEIVRTETVKKDGRKNSLPSVNVNTNTMPSVTNTVPLQPKFVKQEIDKPLNNPPMVHEVWTIKGKINNRVFIVNTKGVEKIVNDGDSLDENCFIDYPVINCEAELLKNRVNASAMNSGILEGAIQVKRESLLDKNTQQTENTKKERKMYTGVLKGVGECIYFFINNDIVIQVKKVYENNADSYLRPSIISKHVEGGYVFYKVKKVTIRSRATTPP